MTVLFECKKANHSYDELGDPGISETGVELLEAAFLPPRAPKKWIPPLMRLLRCWFRLRPPKRFGGGGPASERVAWPLPPAEALFLSSLRRALGSVLYMRFAWNRTGKEAIYDLLEPQTPRTAPFRTMVPLPSCLSFFALLLALLLLSESGDSGDLVAEEELVVDEEEDDGATTAATDASMDAVAGGSDTHEGGGLNFGAGSGHTIQDTTTLLRARPGQVRKGCLVGQLLAFSREA